MANREAQLQHRSGNMHDTIVIGGGIAGLAAARDVARAGLRTLLLEARDRLGGRIHTVGQGEDAIELGAEFIHGEPPLLLKELRDAGIHAKRRDREMYVFADGKLCKAEVQPGDDVFEAIAEYRDVDESFCDFLKNSHFSAEQKARSLHYVEGFNAADAQRISMASLAQQQRAEDEIAGEGVAFPEGGYSRLIDALASSRKYELLLNSAVKRVEWQPGRVLVKTASDDYSARSLIVTIPLSCLQQRSIQFQPPLETKGSALAKLAMGDVVRLSMRFPEPFWVNAAPDLGFLFNEAALPETFPVFWTGSHDRSAVLTAWTAGPRAEVLLARSAEDLAEVAFYTLRQIFGERATRPIHADYYNWKSDPFSRGAYSYVLTGGAEAQSELARPIGNTLFFAGEHTESSGHYATVHGALATGIRAAQEVISALAGDTGSMA